MIRPQQQMMPQLNPKDIASLNILSSWTTIQQMVFWWIMALIADHYILPHVDLWVHTIIGR